MTKITGAGDRDELITFEALEKTPDGSGGNYKAWTVYAAGIWAAVKPLRATETEQQGAVRNARTIMFTVERRTDFDETMRILWGGQTFNIREIRLPSQRMLEMDIIAQSGVTQ